MGFRKCLIHFLKFGCWDSNSIPQLMIRTLDNTVAQHTDLPGEFSVGYLGAQSSCLVDGANLGAKKASQFALAHVYRPCPSNLTYPFSSKKNPTYRSNMFECCFEVLTPCL
jgi:hypothetical protein